MSGSRIAHEASVMRSCLTIGVLAGTLSLLAAGQTWPASQPSVSSTQQDASDPDAIAHGVARLSLMNGAVSVAHGNAGEMTGAVLNSPLLTEDRLLTSANARAEIQLDGANLVRIAGSTEIRLGDLQYKRYQVQLAQGTITYRVLRDNDAIVEISTPTVSVRPTRQGTYRILVNADGLTEVTVRSGDAEISSPSGSEPLRAGQTLLSRGNPSDPEFRTAVMAAPDDWDRWNIDRDRYFDNAATSAQYVSPDIYGTEDLNAYGRWTNDPAYGNVWVPNQSADWAPYQDGRWSYEDYYGWTWIGYEPWGWAPYHYGRWYRGSLGWAWYPGAYGARHYWSPALVGFFGWGYPTFGASFGFGNIGWVPLAPFEVYRPWYGRGIRGTSFVANIGIGETYRNARFPGAVGGIRASEFGRATINGSSLVRPSSADLSHASTFSGGVPFSGAPAGRGNLPAGSPAFASRTNTRFYSSPTFAGSRSPVFSNGTAGGAASAGGWRRIDPSTSGISHAPNAPAAAFTPHAQSFQNPAPGFANGSQPVRIAPPMVNNRQPSFPGFARSTSAPRSAPSGNAGGFGAPRPGFGSSGGFSSGGGFSRSSAPSGGMRSAPSSGRSTGGSRTSHR
jgi:FecR protein